jgi:hypothetical protein
VDDEMKKTKLVLIALLVVLTIQNIPRVNATVYNLNPTADSFVNEGSPTSNYGTLTYLKTGYYYSPPSHRQYSFLKFDLSTVGATPTSAVFYWYETSPSESLYPYMYFFESTDSWTESGITWNNKPSSGESLGTKTVPHTGWYSIDVTSYVADQYAGDKVVTIEIKGEESWGWNVISEFESRESTNEPYLLIDTSGTPTSYDITLSNGQGGIIATTSDGYSYYGHQLVVSVPEGGSLFIDVQGDSGYDISSFLIDGSPAPGNKWSMVSETVIHAYVWHWNYTFTNVVADHTAYASFAQGEFTVQASSSGSGYISPTGTMTVEGGSVLNFLLYPSTGAIVEDVLVDYESVGSLGGSLTYSLGPIDHDTVIIVRFSGSGTDFGTGELNVYVVLGLMLILGLGAVGFSIGDKEPMPALFLMILGCALCWQIGWFPFWIFVLSAVTLALLSAWRFSAMFKG